MTEGSDAYNRLQSNSLQTPHPTFAELAAFRINAIEMGYRSRTTATQPCHCAEASSTKFNVGADQRCLVKPDLDQGEDFGSSAWLGSNLNLRCWPG